MEKTLLRRTLSGNVVLKSAQKRASHRLTSLLSALLLFWAMLSGGVLLAQTGLLVATNPALETTHGSLPLVGTDDYQTTQSIYPQSMLHAMAGSDITMLTYTFAQTPDAAWDFLVEVYLGITAQTDLSEGWCPDAQTLVYVGALNVVDTTVIINFDTPFRYTGGGHLVVMFRKMTSGSSSSGGQFKGIVSPSGSRHFKSHVNATYHIGSQNGWEEDFLPRATFFYNALETTRLTVASGSETNNSFPFFGGSTNVFQTTQSIYPAEMIAEVMDPGTSISSLEYECLYPFSTDWDFIAEVSLGRTDWADLSENFCSDEVALVYRGYLKTTNGILHIDLQTPYTYTGGNLLVMVRIVVTGNVTDGFPCVGIEHPAGSRNVYNSLYPTFPYSNQISTAKDFLPKLTFEPWDGNMAVANGEGAYGENMLPIHANVMDRYQTTQMIYPQHLLSHLTDSIFTAMEFEMTQLPYAPWTSNVEVYLGNTTTTEFGPLWNPDAETLVYSGLLNVVDSTLRIEFTHPFQYTGDHLMMMFRNTEVGGHASIGKFAGIEYPGGGRFIHSETEPTYPAGEGGGNVSIPVPFLPKVTLVPWDDMLTVAHGDGSSSFYPLQGSAMNQYQTTQSIYPAEMLTLLQGQTITALEYRLNTIPEASWNSIVEVWLGMTEQADLSTGWCNDATTLVYAGLVDATNEQLHIDLDLPFPYDGGNLVVMFRNTENTGNFSMSSFYGTERTASSRRIQSDSTPTYPEGNGGGILGNFLPQLSLYVTDGEAGLAAGKVPNATLPVDGTTMDRYQTTQSIYPAYMLSDLSGSTISGIEYTLYTPADYAWTSHVELWLGTTTSGDVASGWNAAAQTLVYSGLVDATGNTLHIDFDRPFDYDGGNLVVMFRNTEMSGIASEAVFLGVRHLNGSRRLSSNTPTYPTGTAAGTVEHFLPKIAVALWDGNPVIAQGKEIDRFPIDGNYMDHYQTTQSIYPASMLDWLDEFIISGLSYDLIEPSSEIWSSPVEIYLGTTETTNLASGWSSDANTLVYSGLIDATTATMQIEFDTPYIYTGGNLVIMYRSTQSGGTAFDAQFVGRVHANGSAMSYSLSPTYPATSTAGTPADFLPKVTLLRWEGATRTFSVEACEAFEWEDVTYTESGEYVRFFGKDSMVTMNLSILHNVTRTEEATACDSYEWHGQTFTSTDIYSMTYSAANGCDSIVYLDLTVGHSNVWELNAVACEAYTWNGQTYTTSGQYTQTLTNAEGCDSTITLYLQINPSDTVVYNIFACDEYTWWANNTTYTTSGTYVFVDNTLDCDAVYQLRLTVSHSTEFSFDTTVCERLDWMTESGSYTDTYTTASGCDSVVTMNLTVLEPATGVDEITACDSYTWIDGNTYIISNHVATYTYEGGAANGCDSVVSLDLTLFYGNTVDVYESACIEYTWEGDTYTTSGTYTKTLTNAVGCDSIVILHLTVNKPDTTVHYMTACNNYTWLDGNTYTASTQSASYYEALPNSCGLVHLLDLTIVDGGGEYTTEAEACGEYHWNGTIYTESGIYAQSLSTADMCDSIVTLHLTILEEPHITIDVTACDHYVWEGATYSNNGTFTRTFTAASGCDSVVTMNLTLVDIPNQPEVIVYGSDYCSSEHGNGIIFVQSPVGSQYEYSIDGVEFQAGIEFSLLPVGVYELFVRTGNGGCTNSTFVEIESVGVLPDAQASNNGPVCEGETVQLSGEGSNTGPYTSYLWTGPNGFTSTLLKPTIAEVTTAHAGIYTLTVTNTVSGCSSQASTQLYITDLPAAPTAITTGNTACNGAGTGTVTVTAPLGAQYQYSIDGSNYRYEPYFSNVHHGTYTLYVRTGDHCANTATIVVENLSNAPTAVISTNHPLCEGGTLILSGEGSSVGSNITYEWRHYGEVFCTTLHPEPIENINSVTNGGVYYLTVTNTENGCIQSVYEVVNIGSHSSFYFYEAVCDSITWNGITYTETGYYTQVLTSLYDGCDSTVTAYFDIEQTPPTPVATSTPNTLCGEEEGYGNGSITVLSPLGSNCYYSIDGINFQTEPVFTAVGSGVYTLYTNYNWGDCNSITTVIVENNIEYPTAIASSNSPVCESGSLQLSAVGSTYNSHTLYHWTGPDDFSRNGRTITINNPVAGTYTLTVIDQQTNCNSSTTLEVEIIEPIYQYISAWGCDTYTLNEQTYTQSGTYSQTFTAANGCDSIVVLELDIYAAPPTATVTVTNNTHCIGESNGSITITAPLGTQYEYSIGYNLYQTSPIFNNVPEGTYTLIVREIDGYCRSETSVTVETVAEFPTAIITANSPICTGETLIISGEGSTTGSGLSYAWTGPEGFTAQTLTPNSITNVGIENAGIYQLTITNNETGCEATDIFYVEVNESTSQNFTLTVCDEYVWNNETYSTSGVYTQTFPNAQGCDSTVTMDLTVYESVSYEWSETALDEYTWNEQTFTQSGDYTMNFTAANGCDSVVTLHLTIYHNDVTHEWDATACDSFTWNDEMYTTSGDFVQIFEGPNYDSIVTLHLVINSSVTHEFSADACDEYVWNNQTYTQSGDYTATFAAANGCDSVVTLHLTIHTAVTHEFSADACDEYVWNNQTYTQSGDYTATFAAANGCDSVVTLHLTIHTAVTHEFSADACDEYAWNNQTYTQSGDYTATFAAANGCDSVVTLHLTINETPVVSITGETTLQLGESTVLTAEGAEHYLWSTGETTAAITVTPDTTTTYSVVGFNGTCESEEVSVMIIVIGAVAEGNEATFSIYPNPAHHYVVIEGEAMSHVELYNTIGQQLTTKTLDGNTTLRLDTHHCEPGIYHLRITTAAGAVVTKQLVIVR